MASNAQKKATKTDLVAQALAAKTGSTGAAGTGSKPAGTSAGSAGSSSSSQEQAKKNAATVANLVNARMTTAGAQMASSNTNAAVRAAVQTQRAQEEAQRKATAQKAREAMADFNKSFGEYAKNAAAYHTGMALTSAAKAAANGLVGLTDDGKLTFREKIAGYDYDRLDQMMNSRRLNDAEKSAVADRMIQVANEDQLQIMAEKYRALADESDLALKNVDDRFLQKGEEIGTLRRQGDSYRSRAEAAENQRWKLMQGRAYLAMPQAEDFEQNSAMVINREYSNQYKTMMGLVSDDDYVAGAQSDPDKWAKANDAYVYGKYMTVDEKKTYSYVYNTGGEKAAEEYLDYLVRAQLADRRQTDVVKNGIQLTNALTISKEAMERMEALAGIDTNSAEYQAMSAGDKARIMASKALVNTGAAKALNYELKKLNKGLATGLSVGTNLLSGLGAIDAAIQKLLNPDKPVIYDRGFMDAASITMGLREGVQEGMNKGERAAYGLITSMMDSAAVAYLATMGVKFTGALLGGSAASSKMLEMHQQGYSDSQCITVGLLTGVAEAMFEEVSIEKLINTPVGRKGMERVIASLVQGGVEASEETATGIANFITEAIILGDKSEYALKKREYILNGMTEDEAAKQAGIEWLQELGMETFAGFLSGGLMSGGRQVYLASPTNVPNQVLMQTTMMVAEMENASPALHNLAEDIAAKLWEGYSVESEQDAAKYLDKNNRKLINRQDAGVFLNAVDAEYPGFLDEVLPEMWKQYEADRAKEAGETIAKKEAEQAAADLGVEETVNTEENTEAGDSVNAETDTINAEADTVNAEADTVKPEIDTKTETEAKPQVRTENKQETAAEAKTEAKRWSRPEVKAQEQTKNSWMSLAENAVAYDDTAAQQNLEQAIAQADTERIQAVLDSMNGQDYYGLAELLTEELDRRSQQETAAEAKTEAQPANLQQTEVQQTEAQQTVENKEDETNGRTDTRAEGTQRETAAAAERGTGTGDQTDSGGRNAYNIGSRQQSQVRSRLSEARNLSGRVLSDVAGIKTDLPVKVLSEQAVADDQELRQIRQDAAVRGIRVEFTLGAIQQNGLRANGLSTAIQQNGQTRRCIVINAVNMFETAQQLYDHEYIHDRMSKDPALRQVVCDYIATLDGFADVAEVYAAKYGPAIEGMSTREAAAYVAEEMLCDAYAGYNRFNSGVTDMMTELRAIADGALGERQAGQQQNDQYSEIKNAVREVLAEAGIVQNQQAAVSNDTRMAVAEDERLPSNYQLLTMEQLMNVAQKINPALQGKQMSTLEGQKAIQAFDKKLTDVLEQFARDTKSKEFFEWYDEYKEAAKKATAAKATMREKQKMFELAEELWAGEKDVGIYNYYPYKAVRSLLMQGESIISNGLIEADNRSYSDLRKVTRELYTKKMMQDMVGPYYQDYLRDLKRYDSYTGSRYALEETEAEEGNGQRKSTEAAYEEAKEKFTVKNYSTDWHSGQLDMVMVAKDKNGNTAGTIEYAVYDGKPYIQMIRTEDGYKRQGVARYLLQNLQMEYPNTAIDFGMTTPDGTALLDSVTHEETSTDEKARLDLYNENNARMAEIENELNRAYELEDSGRNLSEEERALVDSVDELGKEWDDLNEWLYEHREDAKLEPTKRFVTTPEAARTEQETRFAVSDSENLMEYHTGYENVPDNLMGFRTNGNNRGYSEERYPYQLDLLVSVDGGETFDEDSIKGMNFNHAVERAKRNWDEADVVLRLNNKETDTRFAVSDSENAEYMQAVEDGDEEKQRSILDEAAKAAGYPVRAYHGTPRGDRVGTVFRKDRATSGPMAYFTDARNIAENYTKKLTDTSLGNDERLNTDEGHFRVTDRDGNDINIIEAYNKLSPAAKRRITNEALKVTLDDDYENVVSVPTNRHGHAELDWRIKEFGGNTAEALVRAWFESGDIMGNEGLFLDVLEKSGFNQELEKAGMSAPSYLDENYREEKVYDVYLGINNPFVTGTGVNEEFVRGFEDWAAGQDLSKYGEVNINRNSDTYAKGNVTPEQYADRLRTDISMGLTGTWTTVPDYMTDYLKELGYDGIQDTGGKGGGQVHTVWIPFEQNQVKSADLVTYDDDGNVIPLSERFNDQKDDIRWAVADDMEEARQKAHEAFEGGDNEALRQFMYETNADPAHRSEEDIRRNRKMGLFSQEYTQLQPFIRTMAKMFQQDVYESQKGQVLQGEHNAWFAERQTTKPIANLLDRWGLSWQQVQDTIDAMAENDWSGVKNTKAFKAAEVEIDHALRHGYNRIGGQYQSPIQQYVSMANQAITGYATAEEFLQAQNMNSMARDAERQLEDPNNPYRERALPEDTMPDSYNQGRADTAAEYATRIEEEERNNRADRYATNAKTTAMEAVDEYEAPNDMDSYLDELTRQANEDEDATGEVEADEWFPEDIGRDEERNAIYMEQLMEQEAWEQEQENSYLENALNQTNPDDFTPAFDEEGRMDSLLADEAAETNALAASMAERAEEIDMAIAAEIQKRRMLEAVGMDMDENQLPDGLLSPEEEQEWIERARMQKAVETAEAKMENGDDLTLDEWQAVQKQMADEAKNKAIDIIDRTEFQGGEAMQNLGVRISGSFADYNSIQDVLKGIQANQRMEKALEKQLRKLEKKADPAEWKQATYFADAVVEGTVDIRNLPRGVDADLLEKVVELKTAIKACRTDYLDIKKTAISRRNRLLAEEVLSGQKDRKVGLFTLNLLQPERVAAAIYGGKAGDRVYQTYFQPVRQNEGEKLRFIQRQMDAIREMTDSTGKKRIGNVAESMLIQMAMESKSLQDTMDKLEQKEYEAIAAEADLYRQSGKFSWQLAEESQEFTNATLPGETAEQEAKRRADNGRTLTGEQQDLAIRMAGMQTMTDALTKGEMKVEGKTFKVDRVLVENTANKMRELYKQYYEATNEFLVAHGEAPIGFVQDYAPHMQPDSTKLGMEKLLELVGMPGEIGELNASIAGLTHTWKPNKKWNPFFLHRAHGQTIDYDAYTGFEQYVMHLGEVMYHMDDIMRLRKGVTFLREDYMDKDAYTEVQAIKDIRNEDYFGKLSWLAARQIIKPYEQLTAGQIDRAIDDYEELISKGNGDKEGNSAPFVMWMDNYANTLAGKQSALDRGREATMDRGRYPSQKGLDRIINTQTLNTVMNKVLGSNVVASMSSMMNQTSQIADLHAEIKEKHIVKAMRDMVTRRKDMELFRMNNDFLMERKGLGKLNSSMSAKIDEVLSAPARTMDGMLAQIIARSAYYQGLEMGMTERQADEYASNMGEKIQASRAKGSKAAIFDSKNVLTRMLTAFQVEALNTFEHRIYDMPRAFQRMADDKGIAVAARELAKYLAALLMTAFCWNRVCEEVYGSTPVVGDMLGLGGQFVANGYGYTLNDGMRHIINNVLGTNLDEGGEYDALRRANFDGEWSFDAAMSGTRYNALRQVPFLGNVLGFVGYNSDYASQADTTILASSVQGMNDEWKSLKGSFPTEDENGNRLPMMERLRQGDIPGAIEAAFGLLTYTGAVKGVGRQARKTEQGLRMVAEGGKYSSNGNLQYAVDNENPLTWLQAGLFGRSATQSAQRYYAATGTGSTYSASPNQTAVYEMLTKDGMDERDAYERVMADAISKSELTTIQNMVSTGTSAEEALRMVEGQRKPKEEKAAAEEKETKTDKLVKAGLSYEDAYRIEWELGDITGEKVEKDGELKTVTGSEAKNKAAYCMEQGLNDQQFEALSIASDSCLKKYEDVKGQVSLAEFTWAYGVNGGLSGKKEEKRAELQRILSGQLSSSKVNAVLKALGY